MSNHLYDMDTYMTSQISRQLMNEGSLNQGSTICLIPFSLLQWEIVQLHHLTINIYVKQNPDILI